MTSFQRRQLERKFKLKKKREGEKKLMQKMGGRRSDGWQDRKMIIKQNVAEHEIQAQELAESRKNNGNV